VATKALSVSNGAATASGLLTTSYTYDGLGTLISTQYPNPNSLSFAYALDGLERPIGLTDNTNRTWASGVLYNPASQMTNAILPSGTETWGYNTLNQLTQRTTTSGSTTRMNMAYNYTAGKDNGQIAGSTDAVTGETITYLYDSLKRLAKASSGTWSDTYTYDGFGNLTGMTGNGGAPSLSVSVSPATNQITPTNVLYDGNGNVTQFSPMGSLMTLGYDVVNRMAAVNSASAYAYSSANQRVYFRNSTGTETLYVYGTDGKKLATYTIAGITGTTQVNFTMQSQNVYFAGKLISAEGSAVAVDRLGSVRWNAATGGHTYYPYGAEYIATLNDTEKYATYTRDTLTALDYAMNRYYSSSWGRFMTPDRSWSSARPGNPQSWNLYAYAVNDPINGNDPSGNDTYVFDDDGTLVGSCDDDGNCTYYAGINDITVYPGPDDPTPPPPDPPDPPPPPPPPVPPPTPAQPAPTPASSACSLELKYRAVGGGVPWANHSYLWMGTAAGMVTLEGFPQNPSPPFGNLIALTSPNGLNGTDAAGNSEWGPEIESTDLDNGGLVDTALCGQISSILLAETAYNQNQVRYGPIGGPNSNSLAHFFLTAGGLGWVFTAPPGTSGLGGWNTPVYGAPSQTPRRQSPGYRPW
jgi:RHS repeat-associated protein